jgi:ribosomal protein S10
MAVVMHREEVDLSLRSLDSEMLDAVWPQVEEHADKLVCLSLDNNLLHRVPASLCHFHQLRWLHLNE